jgi:hypothetical protein
MRLLLSSSPPLIKFLLLTNVLGNNDINAFPFENYLGRMKNDIQGTTKPLAQFCRRQAEMDNNETLHCNPPVISITESLKNDSTADFVIILPNKNLKNKIIQIWR